MRGIFTTLLTAFAAIASAQDWTNDSDEPIRPVPAPWTLHGTVYSTIFIPLSRELHVKAFSPLERGYNESMSGEFLGGLGLIQIIRYKDSPVGPYDELLISPGFWKYDHTDKDGNVEERKNIRITRIYVSQKYTAYNGRNNWNIPKHLARFDWTENSWGETTVKIYPYDTTGDEKESYPASKPWFQAVFKPELLSGLPFTSDLYSILGANTTLAQPPLPSKDSKYGELVGTKHWAATIPSQKSKRASLGFFDFYQHDGDVEAGQKTNAVGDEYFPNFWPGLLRLNAGMKLEDTTIGFSDPEVWTN
jgi:hypothetical protein